MIRKILLMLPAFLAVLTTGCTEEIESPVTETGKDSISVSTDELHFGPLGDKDEITVTSSGAWRISGGEDWVTPSVTEGVSGDKIVFTVLRNDSEAVRTAVFKVFTGSAVAEIRIYSELGYYLIPQFEETSHTFTHSGITYAMKFKTNIKEDAMQFAFADGGDSWISFAGRSDVFGITTIEFTIAGNTGYLERSSRISITGQGEDFTFDVFQLPTYVVLAESMYVIDGLESQDYPLTVKTNADFTVTNLPEWLSVSSIERGDTDETGLTTVTVTLHLEAAEHSRLGSMSFVSDGTTLSSASVKQNDPNMVTYTIEDSALAEYLIQNGWLLDLEAPLYEVIDKGFNSESLDLEWATGGVVNLSGLGQFTQLKSLKITKAPALRTLDLSDCMSLTDLSIREMKQVREIILGDMPLETFKYGIGGLEEYGQLEYETVTISGNVVKNIDFYNGHYYCSLNEKCKVIDVTGCPALETLNVKRGVGPEYGYPVVLETIRMTPEQKQAVDDGTLVVTRYDSTQIVVVEEETPEPDPGPDEGGDPDEGADPDEGTEA